MKTYVITTGILFALLAVLHVREVVEHWREVAADPWPAVGLLASAVLSVWAFRVARAARRAR